MGTEKFIFFVLFEVFILEELYYFTKLILICTIFKNGYFWKNTAQTSVLLIFVVSFPQKLLFNSGIIYLNIYKWSIQLQVRRILSSFNSIQFESSQYNNFLTLMIFYIKETLLPIQYSIFLLQIRSLATSLYRNIFLHLIHALLAHFLHSTICLEAHELKSYLF